MATVAQVNKELKNRGVDAKIVSGKGYYYFIGELFDVVPAIYTYRIADWSLEKIMDHIKISYPQLGDSPAAFHRATVKDLIIRGGLRFDEKKKRFYYSVSCDTRRNNKMMVANSLIKEICKTEGITNELISKNLQPCQ